MPLNKFIPLSPDPYITSDPEMTLAKFGHLNTIVDYLNGTNALTNIKIAGINNTAGYIDFSANPTGSTTVVGAIRTYVNGVNLSEVMEFREDGNIKVGGILSVGNYANSTGFGQKIRIIGQANASLGIYRNQESTFAAKLEFMKSRGTYDVPLIVNSSDILGSLSFYGYDGTSYSSAAFIQSVALSTSTGVEGDLRFIVFDNIGSNFNPMRITKEGVGIGNALNYIPSSTLQVRGNGSTSATTSLLVQNSSSTQLLKVTDDGVIEAGSSTSTQFKILNRNGLAIARDTNLDACIRINEFGGLGPVLKINGNAGPTFKLINGSNYNCIQSGPDWTGIGQFTVENASAVLQADSTTKGFLKPRLTTAQKNAIATPAAGLEVFDITLGRPCFYSGSAWVTL
jgi:hypothetical protein